MNAGEKKRDLKHVVSDIVGCKWSLAVLAAIRDGVTRPGALERHIDGISAKVLSQRLKKLTRYSILTRTEYAEIPPRVEYEITEQGASLIEIIDAIEELNGHWVSEQT
ncbi:MAG: helix-turn-helix transcriptional regulator [Acidobacteria bacterium]|nr:helix-turn-helix transcriptional regulator [Acidobacteriota bacterium]